MASIEALKSGGSIPAPAQELPPVEPKPVAVAKKVAVAKNVAVEKPKRATTKPKTGVRSKA